MSAQHLRFILRVYKDAKKYHTTNIKELAPLANRAVKELRAMRGAR